MEGMREKGDQVKTLFVQLTHQLIFQSRLFTLSAGLLGSRDLVWGSGGREGSYSWGAAVTVQEEWGAAAGGVRRAAALAHIWWKHQ